MCRDKVNKVVFSIAPHPSYGKMIKTGHGVQELKGECDCYYGKFLAEDAPYSHSKGEVRHVVKCPKGSRETTSGMLSLIKNET
jgi:hypothetical protein